MANGAAPSRHFGATGFTPALHTNSPQLIGWAPIVTLNPWHFFASVPRIALLVRLARNDLPTDGRDPGLDTEPRRQLFDPTVLSPAGDQLCLDTNGVGSGNVLAMERPQHQRVDRDRLQKQRAKMMLVLLAASRG